MPPAVTTPAARSGHAIEGVVASDDPVIAFRVATDGRAAVLAVKQEQTIGFTWCRPDGLVTAVLPLIGDAKPGPGRSGRGGRKGAEDQEHRRPSYLVERDPDSIFGVDEMTAPPVIGG